MANPRLIIAILTYLRQEEENDDDEAVLAALQVIAMRRRQIQNRKRHPILTWLLRKKLIEDLRGPSDRQAITNFIEIVWRYPDTQFQEDFRMTRQRFEVLCIKKKKKKIKNFFFFRNLLFSLEIKCR